MGKKLKSVGFVLLALLPGGLALAVVLGLVTLPWRTQRSAPERRALAVDALLVALIAATMGFLLWGAW